jgi:hypothetical protein
MAGCFGDASSGHGARIRNKLENQERHPWFFKLVQGKGSATLGRVVREYALHRGKGALADITLCCANSKYFSCKFKIFSVQIQKKAVA